MHPTESRMRKDKDPAPTNEMETPRGTPKLWRECRAGGREQSMPRRVIFTFPRNLMKRGMIVGSIPRIEVTAMVELQRRRVHKLVRLGIVLDVSGRPLAEASGKNRPRNDDTGV